MDGAQKRKNLQVGIGKDDVSRSEELQVEVVGAIAELQLYNPVGADLGYGCAPPCLEELPQTRGEGGGCGGGWACEVGQMEAEAGVDDQLLFLAGDGELEQELLGGDVVDIGKSEADQSLRQLVGDGLDEGGHTSISIMYAEDLMGGATQLCLPETYLDVQRREPLLHAGRSDTAWQM